MRSGGIAGRAQQPDHRSLRNAFTTIDIDRIKMGISRLPAIAMIDHHQIPIAILAPPSENDHTCIGGVNRVA